MTLLTCTYDSDLAERQRPEWLLSVDNVSRSTHGVYPHTSSFFVVTFVSLVPKPVAGKALWFLRAPCQCKDCMVCVYLCSHKRE